MANKNRSVDPLPDSFATAAAAGEFWDTHSTMDYQEYLQPVDDVINLKQRVFEVSIAEDVFRRLQQEAGTLRQTAPAVVDRILREKLVA